MGAIVIDVNRDEATELPNGTYQAVEFSTDVCGFPRSSI